MNNKISRDIAQYTETLAGQYGLEGEEGPEKYLMDQGLTLDHIRAIKKTTHSFSSWLAGYITAEYIGQLKEALQENTKQEDE